MSESALRIQGITKRYGEVVAIDNLSFEVPRGVIFGVLGPNGAGKTTTLRMINDILAPDRGEIRILGSLKPGREAAARIGYLPEERGLYPKMRVLAMLQFFGELRGLTGSEARKRAVKWLERLGLEGWKANKVQDLSKGMQQKVQFITALIHEPELLILDEPWSGLDPINADVLREIVLEQREVGRTIMFSTHLMEQAEQIVDSVCIIARGRKVLDGSLSEIRHDAARDRCVTIGFADEASLARAETTVFADAALVSSHRVRGELREAELAKGRAPEELLKALVDADTRVIRFEKVEPTLHQIFVDRVGEDAAEGRREEELNA